MRIKNAEPTKNMLWPAPGPPGGRSGPGGRRHGAPFLDGYNTHRARGYSGTFLFFGLIIYRALYGKVKNPHQSYEDRKTDIQTLVRQILSIAIAVMLYAMLQISLKVFGLESFKAISISLYFHVIGFLSMQWPRLDFINFDVYKDKPVLTK